MSGADDTIGGLRKAKAESVTELCATWSAVAIDNAIEASELREKCEVWSSLAVERAAELDAAYARCADLGNQLWYRSIERDTALNEIVALKRALAIATEAHGGTL